MIYDFNSRIFYFWPMCYLPFFCKCLYDFLFLSFFFICVTPVFSSPGSVCDDQVARKNNKPFSSNVINMFQNYANTITNSNCNLQSNSYAV